MQNIEDSAPMVDLWIEMLWEIICSQSFAREPTKERDEKVLEEHYFSLKSADLQT